MKRIEFPDKTIVNGALYSFSKVMEEVVLPQGVWRTNRDYCELAEKLFSLFEDDSRTYIDLTDKETELFAVAASMADKMVGGPLTRLYIKSVNAIHSAKEPPSEEPAKK